MTFRAVYRHKKSGTEVVVLSLTRPPKTRTFRARGGRRKFDLIKLTSSTKEFIVMGKAAKVKKDEVTDDELQELENLEGTDDEEPETEDEDVSATEDEAPKKGKKDKKGKKGKKDKGAKAEKQSRAAANGKVGTQEIVKHVNENGLTDKPIDSRQLRMVLRKHRGEKGIELNPETNRWEWDSIDAKPVQAIIKFVKAGEVEAVKQEGLDRLKQNREDAKAKQEDGKGGKKNKKDKKKNKK